MRFSFSILFFVLFSTALLAMQQPYDFGDVPREQFEKKTYSIDSSASAIVLFDVGRSFVDFDLKVRFERHVRIKVLSDAGLKRGDISIGYRQIEPEQDVNGIEAVAYNINERGKISQTKLRRRDIFEEEVSDKWAEVKFSVPGLKQGSIFEYKYEIESESPLDIRSWQFQKNIPVLWSEYTAEIPEWFNYLTYIRSFHEVEYAKESKFNSWAKIEVQTGAPVKGVQNVEATAYRREGTIKVDYVGNKYEWAMKDIPALDDEPYINSVNDYSAKVILQLNVLQFPYSVPEPILTDWLGFVELMSDHSLFGEQITSDRSLGDLASKIVRDKETDLERMIAIYRHIRDRMTWDETYGLFIDEDVGTIYEQGTGNGSEINGLLVQMLREVGLDSDPLVLSTKSHGEILEIFPIVEQFNHTLARVKVDSVEYLLDATKKNKPYNILPIASQNGQGLLIDKMEAAWVPLVDKVKARSSEMITVKIDSTGSYSGNMESKFMGYYAYGEKEKIGSDDINKAIHEKVFKGSDAIKIDSVSTSSSEEDQAFYYSVNFSSTQSELNSNADVMYFNPFIIKGLSENPFSTEERKYPVDFSFPFSHKVVMRITLPDGWKVEEAPESKIGRLPNRMGEFRRIIQPSEGAIVMLYTFDINTYKVMPEQYPYLRAMFQLLVKSTSENIVLKKI